MRPQPDAICRFSPFSYTIGVSIFGKKDIERQEGLHLKGRPLKKRGVILRATLYKPKMFPETIFS